MIIKTIDLSGNDIFIDGYIFDSTYFSCSDNCLEIKNNEIGFITKDNFLDLAQFINCHNMNYNEFLLDFKNSIIKEFVSIVENLKFSA